MSYIITKKLLVSYDVLFQEKTQELIAMESQDEYGNQVPLSKEGEDRIFSQTVEASSHGIYTCMRHVEIDNLSLHLMPLQPQHPLRRLINGLESLSQHNLSCRRKYLSYEVTLSPLMSGDFRSRR